MSASDSRPISRRTLPLVAAIAAGSLSLAAAASPTAVPATSGDLSIALRMEEVGGLAPFQAGLTRVPAFTLYEDGRVVYASPDVPDDGPLPPLQQATLTGDEAEALLDRALEEGGLRDARPEYAVDGVADATTTVFTVSDDDTERTVSIYGLGFGDEGPDREALRRFQALAELLSDPDAWLPEGTEVIDYEPLAYRGIFTEDDPEGPDVVPWPWDDLTPDDLRPVEDASAISQTDLTPEQVALVTDVPNGGAFGIAIASPDGQAAWRLSIRPLLPDDVSLTAQPGASAAPTTAAPATPPPSDDDYAYGN